ncbi:MAG: hypothetical protein M3R36_12290 [Bacteroidota bacterium]|nr:hypothetical protein [Bacteroidota bacterium]
MKTFLQNYSGVIRSLILLISLSLTGGNCEKILQNDPVVTGEIIGDWQLIEQTGALQDICDDETVNFSSTGIALLTCPNATSISRNYSIVNNELLYTQTTISYNIEFSQDFLVLYMTGIGVSRNLTYQKIITGNYTYGPFKKTDFNNSSEYKK